MYITPESQFGSPGINKNLTDCLTGVGLNNFKYKSNKTPLPLCVCRSLSTPDHYILEFPITYKHINFANHSHLQLDQWTQLILQHSSSLKEITNAYI